MSRAERTVPRPLSAPRPHLAFSERKLLLRSGDCVALILAVGAAMVLWLALDTQSFSAARMRDQWPWIALLFGVWWVWLELSVMYDLRRAVRAWRTVRRVVAGVLINFIAYLLLFFVTSRTAVTGGLPDLLGNYDSSPPLRFAPVVAILVSGGLLLALRLAYIAVLAGPHMRRRVLILGAGAAGQMICRTLHKNTGRYFTVVGFVDDRLDAQASTRAPVLGTHAELAQIVFDNRVDELVLATRAEVDGELFQAMMDCYAHGVTITPMPLLYEQITGRIAVEHAADQWYVALPFQPQETRAAQALLKRMLDLVLGLLMAGGMALLLPLIALAIRLDSRGPVLYTQPRLGRHGRVFTVYKFRSMVADAEALSGPRWATRDDPRITRVGLLLRKTRIDEWPQIWNVLRGEMSLVGPRPERPELVGELQAQIPFYRTRLAVLPGLTGWAQVNLGYSDSIDGTLAKLQYDLYYIKHQSLLFDLSILLRTVMVVLRMQGR